MALPEICLCRIFATPFPVWSGNYFDIFLDGMERDILNDIVMRCVSKGNVMEYGRKLPKKVLDLRREAEKKIAAKDSGADLGAMDVKRLYHELQVHQVELEMQHSELQQSHRTLELLQEQFAKLYDFAPVSYLSLTRNGYILKCNFAAAELVGMTRSEIDKQSFTRFVAGADRPVFVSLLERAFGEPVHRVTSVLRLLKQGGDEFFARMEAQADQSGQECLLALVEVAGKEQAEDDRRYSGSHPGYLGPGPGTPRAESSSPPAGEARRPNRALSRRERETLKLVVEGKTNSAIAELMHISPKSVETYRSRLMLKLGINNVPDLVKYAILNGFTSI